MKTIDFTATLHIAHEINRAASKIGVAPAFLSRMLDRAEKEESNDEQFEGLGSQVEAFDAFLRKMEDIVEGCSAVCDPFYRAVSVLGRQWADWCHEQELADECANCGADIRHRDDFVRTMGFCGQRCCGEYDERVMAHKTQAGYLGLSAIKALNTVRRLSATPRTGGRGYRTSTIAPHITNAITFASFAAHHANLFLDGKA